MMTKGTYPITSAYLASRGCCKCSSNVHIAVAVISARIANGKVYDQEKVEHWAVGIVEKHPTTGLGVVEITP